MLNKIKKFGYTDILGWSVSRYDKFSACRRQYFYDYYAKFDPEHPRAKIDTLKKMTSVPLETGNIVHDAIKVLLERLLVSEAPVDKDRFFDFALEKARSYCSSKVFSEVYYGDRETVNPDDVFTGVKNCLSNFLGSERYDWIIKKAITNKTGWVVEPPGFGETRISGMKAYCKVDFLFPVENEVFILDWKTGRQDERKHKKQMLGYSSWAAYHCEISPDRIVPVVVYLQPAYGEMHAKFDDADVAGFITQVEAESKEMQGFCANVEKNIPRDKSDFVKTENPRICQYCNYRELCR
jgi:hypothetical protein